ncbi:MAG: NUMOD4 domain-containing protein [Nanoarchaeota archaeon]
MKEIWKDVVGYEGIYKVSNRAKVKSLPRLDALGHKRRGKIIKPRKSNRNYLRVALYKKGIAKDFSIHRLVAIAFISNPYNYPQVHHKNDIQDDNYLENFKWGTALQNTHDAIKNGCFANAAKGDDNSMAKFSKEQVIEMRKMWGTGKFYQKQIAEKFNTWQGTVSAIVLRKSWKHI